MKEIKNYEVVINEGNAKCALIVNEEEEILNLIKDKELNYEVDFNDPQIIIFEGEKKIMVFKNTNSDLLRFAYKSNGVPLAIGTVETNPPQILYETYLLLK